MEKQNLSIAGALTILIAKIGNALTNMKNEKTPGIDVLSSKFFIFLKFYNYSVLITAIK